MEEYKVYIQVDAQNRVIQINSSAFLKDITGFIEISKGTGDKFHHAQGNYFDNTLQDENGLHNYIYENGACREQTEHEKTAELSQRPQSQPSEAQRLRADIDFLAIMQGVEL